MLPIAPTDVLPASIFVPRARPETFAEAKVSPPNETRAQPEPRSAPAARLSERFDRLVETGKMVDAFAAYQMSAQCAASQWWRDNEKVMQEQSRAAYRSFLKDLPRPEVACGDLSPGQIGTRVELLRRSAAAGVHGAYAALNLESPASILQGFSMNEWLQLSQASFEAGFGTADPMVLIERSGQAANCPNVPLCTNPSGDNFGEALKYLIAFREAQIHDAGPFAPEQERALQTAISRYSASLSSEVIARSQADGKALVETAKAP